MKPTTKYSLTLLGVRDGKSYVRAVQALAEVTEMSLAEARYVVNNLPQLLASNSCETFRSWVMTKEECDEALKVLNEWFESAPHVVSEKVLPYGMTAIPPWSPLSGDWKAES